jgi:hypothetical protein
MNKKISFKSKHDFDVDEQWANKAITLKQACETLNYSPSQLIRLIRLQYLRGFKSKGKWFVVLPNN